MTTKDYYTTIKEKYPNTFIGLNAFYTNNYCKSLQAKSSGLSGLINTPLDYMITIVIRYVEYREVNFLEALCNTHIDNTEANHETLRFLTITTILNRLEKFITPVEGKPF